MSTSLSSVSPDEYAVRLGKLEQLRQRGIQPYPERFVRSHPAAAISTLVLGTPATIAGRIVGRRVIGKICFCHILDDSGRAQVVLQQDVMGVETFSTFVDLIDVADFIGVSGEVFVTKSGEVSLLAKEWTFLGKALRPLPEKWHGLKDQETRYRQRYLDLISDPDTKRRFVFRSALIRAVREFYWQQGFQEVETPTLLHAATGAAARPYQTHNHALDIDLVLRISHELPLKELVVGGFEKIFEIGKAFRNEGYDPSHLPEHTHIEHYAAYWNYQDNIDFTEQFFSYLFTILKLSTKITIRDRQGNDQLIDFAGPWPRISFIELLKRDTGLDVMEYQDVAVLRSDMAARGITVEGMATMSLATLIDSLFKKVSRPKLIQPTILYQYPKVLQPLARVSDADNRLVDQFQVVVAGWELVKAYSELVDPIDQQQRFIDQAKAHDAGDDEAMVGDAAYITAMEHGMPPISGWSVGLDRLIALLTQQDNLRDVVLFPLLRPEDSAKK